ncbi:MAG: VWA domain-containing protein, partial [Gemmatimonadetes bacterium]|nr:VWA domain-containing protein [Gemmatimonadota bacterium]
MMSIDRLGRLIRDARGSVLMIVAVGMVFILGMTGLAVDSGRGYLTRLRLVRAVDAAALTGARTLRSGETAAREQATATAYANGVGSTINGAALSMTVSTDEQGESLFQVDATQTIPTILMRLLGIDHLDVRARSVAAVPPVDLILVVDQSGSLGTVGAWDDLQAAATEFIQNFDDDIDQLGLVSFQTRAANRFQIAHGFRVPLANEISGMSSAGWTNYGEGLRLAHGQITSSDVRERSVKVVVFFTDGRPTAFRGTIGGEDRIMATSQELPPEHLGGYYDDPDSLPLDGMPSASGCRNLTFCNVWTEQAAPQPVASDALNHDLGRQMANQIRGEDVLLYTIGLGNTTYSDPAFQPNQAFL